MKTAIRCALLAMFCLSGYGPGAGVSQAARLEEVIEGARREGALNVMLPSTVTPEVVKALEAAMNKHYGTNVRIKYVAAGNYVKAAAIAITEHRTGTTPTFDATIGYDANVIAMLNAGAVESVENWKELAPKGTPLEDKSLSPPVLKNAAFKFVDNFHVMIYNSKLLSKADVPRNLADLGHPKYKGKFAVPPYILALSEAMLVYDREKVLEIYRSWGRNQPKIQTPREAIDRVVLGEIWLTPFPNDYDYYRRRQAGDPVGMAFFQDFVPWTSVYMSVRAKALNGNAAKLWALFNAGPEAQRIWEKELIWMSISYPQQSRGKEMKQMIEEAGAKIVSWVESEETIKTMRWLTTTKEGNAYQNRVRTAIMEGR